MHHTRALVVVLKGKVPSTVIFIHVQSNGLTPRTLASPEPHVAPVVHTVSPQPSVDRRCYQGRTPMPPERHRMRRWPTLWLHFYRGRLGCARCNPGAPSTRSLRSLGSLASFPRLARFAPSARSLRSLGSLASFTQRARFAYSARWLRSLGSLASVTRLARFGHSTRSLRSLGSHSLRHMLRPSPERSELNTRSSDRVQSAASSTHAATKSRAQRAQSRPSTRVSSTHAAVATESRAQRVDSARGGGLCPRRWVVSEVFDVCHVRGCGSCPRRCERARAQRVERAQ